MISVREAEAALERATAAQARALERVNTARRVLREAKAAAAARAVLDARNATANARRKAKALAAAIGAEIERHDDLGPPAPYFVSHPALEGAADPYEGDHYAYSWGDVLDRLEGYRGALNANPQPLLEA